jgi:hypothetical protein
VIKVLLEESSFGNVLYLEISHHTFDTTRPTSHSAVPISGISP